MASTPLQVYPIASASSLSLSTNGQINLSLDGFYAFNFDLNITSTTGAGNIEIYLQSTNPVGDTFTGTPVATVVVAAGTFPSSKTRFCFPTNGNVISFGVQYCVIKWVGTGDGSIALVGNCVIY